MYTYKTGWHLSMCVENRDMMYPSVTSGYHCVLGLWVNFLLSVF